MAVATPKRRLDLPPLELECMKALWALGAGTVNDVRRRILPQRELAYTTIMTVMDRLARKGIVEREKKGRAHLYRPRLSEGEARDRAVEKLVDNFFRGSRERLAAHLNSTVMSPARIPSPPRSEPKPEPAPKVSAADSAAGIDDSLL